MKRPLFRPEVAQARRAADLGRVSVAQPVALSWLTLLAVCAAVAVVALLVFGEYTRRARVTGQLLPDRGLTVVVAPVDGVVARVLPHEGDEVAMDAVLAVVSVPRSDGDGASVWEAMRTQIDLRKQSLDAVGRHREVQSELERNGLLRQLDEVRRALARNRAAISSRAQQVALAQAQVQRYREGVERGVASELQLDEREMAALALIEGAHALEREQSGLQREEASIEQQLAQLPASQATERALQARDRALLAQEEVERAGAGALTMRAPVAGRVANRLVEPGQAVRAGQPLVTLVPEGSELLAELRVPSHAVAFVHPGDRVLLRYRAFPYQRFGQQLGWVEKVSLGPISTIAAASAPGTPERDADYRVLVRLERQNVAVAEGSQPLMPGMSLEADVLAERRKLYEWLFEPVLGMRQRNASMP